ncbi:hypothetical protein [Phenylobacterium sp.]|uniref:hypothetical protein n=1 Tax=Phenylobacterium sp. TaxID=1871053 RepID=UPI0030F4865E
MIRSFAQVGGGQAAYTLFQGLFVLASVRFLAPQALAEFSIGIAIFTIASGLSTSALRRAYILDYEELGLSSAQGHFLAAQVLLLIAGALVITVLSGVSAEVSLSLIALIVANTIFENARLFFQRHESFRNFGLLTALQPAVGLLGLAALLAMGAAGVHWAAAGWAVLLSQAASRLVLLPLFGRRIVPLFTGATDGRSILAVLRHLLLHRYYLLSLYYGILNWLLTSGMFFLSRAGNELETAAYGATQRYYGILLALVITAQSVLLPALAKAETLQQSRGVIRSYYVICLPLTAALAVVAFAATWWIPLVDGGKYPSSVPSFQILAAMVAISLWTSIHSTIVTKEKKYVALLLYAVGGAVVTTTLSALSPPSAFSVALATAIGFALSSIAVAIHSELLMRKADSRTDDVV